jgi:hypothetical protein
METRPHEFHENPDDESADVDTFSSICEWHSACISKCTSWLEITSAWRRCNDFRIERLVSGENTMSKLLDLVLRAHGGLDRWNKFNRVSATFVSGGGLLPMKGLEVDPKPLEGSKEFVPTPSL